jgi:hypothetical protein
MNIVYDSGIVLKEVKQNPEFLPAVLDQIFWICKEDKSFKITDKIKSVDKQLEILKLNIRKQDSLLEQANTLKENINSKITSLDEDAFRTKAILLESLGSEL